MDILQQSFLKEEETDLSGREDDTKARAIQVIKIPT